MSFLYETHLHTVQTSACGKSTGREHVRRYRDLGFDGIFVTDHFFGGNCAVPRSLPWPEWVDAFCAGYEDAAEEGAKIGFDVFFGWEQGYGDDEYLVYGLDKAWLLAHPEIARCSRRRQLELVHEGGGCVIQAHPFRMRAYMQYIRLGPQYCDGIEAANAGNHQVNDTCAWNYAQEFSLLTTAGTDNHDSSKFERQEQLYGVCLEERLTSAQDYARLILSRGKIGLHVPEERFHADPAASKTLVSYWLDDKEELVPTGRNWILPAAPGKKDKSFPVV